MDPTSKNTSACTLASLPGVDLVGAADGQQDFTWSLARQSARYSVVTHSLAGPHTSTSCTCPGPPAAATSSDDYTQAELTWNEPVLLQDGATYPGPYATPVVPGS